MDLTEELMLDQLVNLSTRFDAILDLIFSNNSDIFNAVNLTENISLSDHRTLIGEMSISLCDNPDPPTKNHAASCLPEYDQWDIVSQNISWADWTNFEASETSDEMLHQLTAILESAVTGIAVQKSDSSNLTKEGNPFKSRNRVPRDVRIQLRRKLSASNKLKTAPSVNRCIALRDRILKAEESLKLSQISRHQNMETKAWSDMKRNPKAFYSYISRVRKSEGGVGPFVDSDGNLIAESTAETLNTQFCSVFSNTDPSQERIFIHDTKS